VLISVTTIPATANAVVALAYGVREEAVGSALQLILNVVAIVVAGALTLLVQRVVWKRPRPATCAFSTRSGVVHTLGRSVSTAVCR
jgi:hypothetical protein